MSMRRVFFKCGTPKRGYEQKLVEIYLLRFQLTVIAQESDVNVVTHTH